MNNQITIQEAEEGIRSTLYALKEGDIDVLTAFVKLNLYYDQINLNKVKMIERKKIKHTVIKQPSHLRIKR